MKWLTTTIATALAASIACGGLVGCTSGTQETSSVQESTDATETTTLEVSDEATGDDATFETIAASFDASALDLDYTDRDTRTSYDESAATKITLEGTAASVEGAGAQAADDGIVTITAAGTYVVTGELTDGQLLVNAGDGDKVQIVLAGATIHNEDGPAIYIQNADKCFITLDEGTENTLTDGSTYTLEEDSDEPYATLFSRDDLTINGTGALNVQATYCHGICSKDDLVITGGTFNVSAVEDALRGRDCVKILDGTFNLAAGNCGIKSNNDSKATKGFVSIDGGTFNIEAGNKAVKAKFYVRVAGGTWDVASTDDAFHSDLEMLLADGTLSVAAGDDAFHAETVLAVDGGTVNVTSCYEGYEAEKIYVNGGDTNITASDDAINASAADLSEDDSTEDVASDTLPDGGTPGNMNAVPGGTGGAQGDPGAGGGMQGGDPGAGGNMDGSQGADLGAGAGGDAQGGNPGADPGAGMGSDAQGAGMGGIEPPSDTTNPRDNEAGANGGAPDNAFAEGMAGGGQGGQGGGMTMGDENCLIQINGGSVVLDSAGDAIDSNGSVEITGGTVLVNGPTSGGDGAFDYDLTATISGGTVLMLGSTGMAQNFTSGTQPFAFTTSVNGSAGDEVQILDADGNVLISMTATKQFGMVLASCGSFTEGGEYTLVVGSTTSTITASTTASGGMGGLGADGNPMGAGQPGDVQMQMR